MIGLLCIHGFTGSPKEIEPLTRYLKANTDWFINAPILPGHGEELTLKGIGYGQWLAHAEKELINMMKICQKVYICGFSMGGLIASWLTSRYPVKGLVLLNAAAYYLNPKNLYRELTELFISGNRNSCHRNDAYERYKRKLASTPISAYFQFQKLVKITRPIIREVMVPTLIVQGKRDPLVPEKSAHYIFENVCSRNKRLLFIEEGDHMICYGSYQNDLFREILNFLENSHEEIFAREYK